MIEATVTLFLSALFCLVLETAGTPEGFRKSGTKPHIFLVAFLSVVAAAAWLCYIDLDPLIQCADLIGAFSTLMTLVLAAPQLRRIDREIGESYALIVVAYALFLWMIHSQTILQASVCTSLWLLIWICNATFRESRRITSELSAKLMLMVLFWFSLMLIGLVIPQFAVLGLLILMGITPFYNFHASYIEGAPSFSAVAFANGIFVAGGIMLMHHIPVLLLNPQAQFFLIAISLVVPGILALDQQKIGRLCVQLLFIIPGLWLSVILLKQNLAIISLIHLSIITVGVLTGLLFWKHSTKPDKTWEDFAGAGRKHPVISVAWLACLASIVGVPGTLGFDIRLELVRAASLQAQNYLAYALVASSIIAAVPIIRLGVFMFAKPTHFDLAQNHQPRQNALIVTCGLATLFSSIVYNFFS